MKGPKTNAIPARYQKMLYSSTSHHRHTTKYKVSRSDHSQARNHPMSVSPTNKLSRVHLPIWQRHRNEVTPPRLVNRLVATKPSAIHNRVQQPKSKLLEGMKTIRIPAYQGQPSQDYPNYRQQEGAQHSFLRQDQEQEVLPLQQRGQKRTLFQSKPPTMPLKVARVDYQHDTDPFRRIWTTPVTKMDLLKRNNDIIGLIVNNGLTLHSPAFLYWNKYWKLLHEIFQLEQTIKKYAISSRPSATMYSSLQKAYNALETLQRKRPSIPHQIQNEISRNREQDREYIIFVQNKIRSDPNLGFTLDMKKSIKHATMDILDAVDFIGSDPRDKQIESKFCSKAEAIEWLIDACQILEIDTSQLGLFH